MWQTLLRHCAVLTKVSEEFAPHYLAEIRHDMRQTTIHPIRAGRSPQQSGRKGLSNHRWIVGGKVCLLINQWGLVAAWDCAAAHLPDKIFQGPVRPLGGRMIILSKTAFHATTGDPANLTVCRRGKWNDRRMLIETVLSMLTVVCHCKKVMHRGWAYFYARLAFTMAAFNVLIHWQGLPTDK